MSLAAPDSLPSPPAPQGKPYALLVLLQLHWFIRLRWVFAGGALGLLAVERFLLPESRRPWQLLLVILCVAATNVVWAYVSRLQRRELEEPGSDQRVTIRNGQIFAGAQIATDLALLTWILSLSGGVENPMFLFYLFHVGITGLLLRTWQAFVQSLWAFVLFAAMCVAQANGWIASYPFLPHLGSFGLHNQPQFVGVVIAVMGLSIFGTLYFTDRIGRVLDQRENMLIRANAALEKSRQAIQDLQVRRSRFMQTAAHQLKSPLAMVQTLANLIRDGIVTDMPQIKATSDKIVRRARDGIGQVTELLTLARVQEADPQRHRASLSDVGQVVSDLCAKYAVVAREKQIQFDWRIPTDRDLAARVHPADLADCIGNLVENAIKYTPSGGRVKVAVLCGRRPSGQRAFFASASPVGRRSDEFVFVVVRDTGIGLGKSTPVVRDGAPEEGSIFDAFRRGDTAILAGIPGTGLGLSIVREVIEQAGGYIHVHSRAGAGSTFTVSFPARSSMAGEVRDTRSSRVVVGP